MKYPLLAGSVITTPLGKMYAVGSDESLYFLEFYNPPTTFKRLQRLLAKLNVKVLEGHSQSLSSIRNELELYFNHKIKGFSTPITLIGTTFQKTVWQQLRKTSFGHTWSYSLLAQKISHPSAYRAVANANGCNNLAIIIPCHQVINANGEIGGYAGGVDKKLWLLNHEKSMSADPDNIR